MWDVIEGLQWNFLICSRDTSSTGRFSSLEILWLRKLSTIDTESEGGPESLGVCSLGTSSGQWKIQLPMNPRKDFHIIHLILRGQDSMTDEEIQ